MATDFIREVVSKQKKRFVDERNGFNLDLSYIGPENRIIAMGYPAEGYEAIYRNAMSDVKRFFDVYHKEHVRVYNLCSERKYQVGMDEYFEECENFGFDDHNPPPLELIGPFCESMHQWLSQNETNVAAVHCKAGKGRTGVMVSSYLIHSGICGDAEKALQYFGEMRTYNAKGVTIPSQMRYVHYYEQLILRGSVTPYTYQITHLRFVSVPSFKESVLGGGCTPYFDVTLYWTETGPDKRLVSCKKLIYSYKDHVQKLKHFPKSERFVDLDCKEHKLLVHGDVKVQFYEKTNNAVRNNKKKMCSVWFHTAFVDHTFLCFEKSVVDKACKDKNQRFDQSFKLEIFLHKVDQKLTVEDIKKI